MNAFYPIEIFWTEDGRIELEVQLKEETVWLTQKQMGWLFEGERSVITKHINTIFKEGELVRNSACANLAHTAENEKTYQTNHFNLDVIISMGCRSNPVTALSSAYCFTCNPTVWTKPPGQPTVCRQRLGRFGPSGG